MCTGHQADCHAARPGTPSTGDCATVRRGFLIDSADQAARPPEQRVSCLSFVCHSAQPRASIGWPPGDLQHFAGRGPRRQRPLHSGASASVLP
jgi:hypothetical protein